MTKIGILVKPDGSLEMRTEGFAGPACLREAEEIIEQLNELGVEVKTTDIKETEEFNVQVEQRTQVQS